MALKHVRKLGSIAYTSGGRATLEIDRAGVWTRMWLHLQFTVTNGSSAAVAPMFQTLARLIKRVEVLVGGRDTVVAIPGWALSALVQYSKVQAFGMDSSVVLTGSATATTYKIAIPLDFCLPDGVRPDDTALDLRRTSQCTVAVTWGPSDCSDFYGTPNSAAISAVTLNVEGEYYLVDDPAGTIQYMVRTLDTVEATVTGNSDNFDIILDRQSGLFYRRLMMIATDASVGSNSIITNVKLQSGTTVFMETSELLLRARNKNDQPQANLIAGVYDVSLPFFGQATTLINTSLLTADLKFTLGVAVGSGTTKILVVREAVRPLKLA